MAMPLEMIWVLAGAGLLMLGALALRMIFAPENAQDRARAARLKAMQPAEQRSRAEAIVRDQSRSTAGRDWPVLGNLTTLMRHAGLEGRGVAAGMLTACGALAAAALLSFQLPVFAALPAGAALSGFGAISILKARHRRRVDALTQQLPDALELMMRGLRVGHPISATIANVGRTMADPVGAEFRLLAEQVRHGDYLTDAFKDFADRVGQEDVEYLAVSISIQHGTGGNLAGMLETLSKVVRDRIVMRRRIKAISSEGRISAWLLSALPVVIYLATSITAPDYYGGVSGDPLFKPIAAAIVALVIANFLALRKLVSFQF